MQICPEIDRQLTDALVGDMECSPSPSPRTELFDLPADVLSMVLANCDVISWAAASQSAIPLRDAAANATVFEGLLRGLATPSVQAARFDTEAGTAWDDSVVLDESPEDVAALLEHATALSSRELVKRLWPFLDPRREQNVRDAVHVLSLSPSASCGLHISLHRDPLTNAWLFDGSHNAVSRKLVVYNAKAVLDVRLVYEVQRTATSVWEPWRQRNMLSDCFDVRTHVFPAAASWCTVLPFIMHAKRLSHVIMSVVDVRREQAMRQEEAEAAAAEFKHLEWQHGLTGTAPASPAEPCSPTTAAAPSPRSAVSSPPPPPSSPPPPQPPPAPLEEGRSAPMQVHSQPALHPLLPHS